MQKTLTSQVNIRISTKNRKEVTFLSFWCKIVGEIYAKNKGLEITFFIVEYKHQNTD